VELNNREEAIIVWEDGLAAFQRSLRRACVERDAERTKTETV
jgi:hypothetical protein